MYRGNCGRQMGMQRGRGMGRGMSGGQMGARCGGQMRGRCMGNMGPGFDFQGDLSKEFIEEQKDFLRERLAYLESLDQE